jgi:hypothetical protein
VPCAIRDENGKPQVLPVFFVGFPLRGVKAGYISRPYRALVPAGAMRAARIGIRRARRAAAGRARRFHRSAAACTARGTRNPEESMSASPAERKAGPVSIVRIEAAINAWREVYPPAPDGEDGYVLDAGSNCLAELYGTMICYRLPDVPLDSLSDAQRDALYATEA